MEKLKIGNFLSKVAGDVTDVATQVVDSVKEKREAKEKEENEKQAMKSGMYEKDGKVVVTSLEGLHAWLTNAQSNASPSILEIVQTQLMTLQSIKSPVLQGMALDTLLQSLYQSLENEENEIIQKNIRNIYASMVQNMFFFSEAKLCYAIQKNKDEALSLIGQAGDQLSGTVMKVAKMMGGGTPLQIANLFADAPAQTGFFSEVCNWISDRNAVQKSIADYRKSLENMFESFDRYSSLLGPSILIQGMLAKYRVELVGMKKQEKLQPIIDKIKSKKNGAFIQNLGESLKKNTSSTKGLFATIAQPAGVVNLASSIVTSVGSYLADSDLSNAGEIDAMITAIDYRENILSECESKLKTIKEEKNELVSRKSQLGILKASEKQQVEQLIQEKDKEIETLTTEIKEANKSLEVLDEFVPHLHELKTELDKYEAELVRIENEFTIKGFEGDVLKR